MCRLFGLHAGRQTVDASFWLLDAPDSLESQSHRNPDGFGIGAWSYAPGAAPGAPPRAEPGAEPGAEPAAEPVATVDKAPRPAWDDPDFATDAHRLTGTTFVAHVRHASTGALSMVNTHPFEQEGRLFAHNGAFGDLPTLDARLAELEATRLVQGDTDSERYFALVTASIARRGGDVAAGVTDAVAWMTGNVSIVSLNFVMTTATDVWAFRYPATDTLFVLERPAGGESGGALTVAGSHLAAGSPTLADHPSVVVASEQLDGEPGWRAIVPGELVHVDVDLDVSSTVVVAAEPPRGAAAGTA
ncbi:class II glutamine amidotransferase [Curtobacterium sp. ISL-83]|uniref:class II glutamine amidotransferase n=1 Tax=Curtobacterium sp. ISL-83 TaxID=2819145 RepID=UPI001BE5E45B|nr:class II glutamine amidotransferase [Curtobacterium sp. ISL-83]MBT2503357.1 class II glutamine amidotransferase [Curtobacterium sp. ISL-83]